MKNSLILLAKYPIAHGVKTRLIQENLVSAEEAKMIYEEILCNQIKQLTNSGIDFSLCVSYECGAYFDIENSVYSSCKKIYNSQPDNVHEKIKCAFLSGFEGGSDKIIVSVTDAVYPTVSTFQVAFDLLNTKDVVLGESNDGGFYLIGLKKYIDIFQDIEWSTERVFRKILKNIRDRRMQVSVLKPVLEVDTIEDLMLVYKMYRHDENFQHRYKRTWEKSTEVAIHKSLRDKKDFDTFIFDLGGILVNINYDLLYREFEKIGYNNLCADYGKENQSCFFNKFEIGLISERDFLDSLREKCHDGVTAEEIRNAWNSLVCGVDIKMIEMLREISEKYKCILLSNINPLHKEKVFSEVTKYTSWIKFQSYFASIYFSHEIGLRKPDVKVFEKIIEHHDLNPEKTIFIDDSRKNVDVAVDIGFKTVLVLENSRQSFIHNLSDLL